MSLSEQDEEYWIKYQNDLKEKIEKNKKEQLARLKKKSVNIRSKLIYNDVIDETTLNYGD